MSITLKIKGIRLFNTCIRLLCCASIVTSTNLYARLDQADIKEINVNWKCQWCPSTDNKVSSGEIEAGIGTISNDSYKHGDYRGLNEKSNYFLGNAEYRHVNSNSNYVELNAENIALDSRVITIEGGSPASFNIELNYAELPKLNSDTSRTPYNGVQELTLPAGWVAATSTTGMTALTNSLHSSHLKTDRKTIEVNATYIQSPDVLYNLHFQRFTKEGKKSMGLAIGNSFATAWSAILPTPISYTVNQGNAQASYRTSQWQSNIRYQFSTFDNQNSSLRWDNAFSNPLSATQGQAALEPDNTMQKISMDGAYTLSTDTRISARLNIGRLEQNDNFLPYTINSNLSPPPLPRNSLNGKINTFNTAIRLTTRWREAWRLSVQYRQNEQDNKTPRSTYDYVIADTAIASTARANLPYSFRSKKFELNSQYKMDKQREISLDYLHMIHDRTYQAVESSNENTLSAKYRNDVNDQFQWDIRFNVKDRRGDTYSQVSEIIPSENILLRKYNLADLKRNSVAVSSNYIITDNLQFGAVVDYAKGDYSNSALGLQTSKQSNYILDMQYRITKKLNMTIDFNITNTYSDQLGVNWLAKNDERIDVVNIGADYEMIQNKLKFRAIYSYSDATNNIDVSTGSGFPGLNSNRQTIVLFADYKLDKLSALQVYFSYESYDESNWSSDSVVANTLDNVLGLGEVSPSYDIGVLVLSYKTRF